MNVWCKSTTVVLAGILGFTGAVLLPFQQAFGEGGARRDVVRHAPEALGVNMETLYLVEFESSDAGAQPNREQVIERLNKLVIPTLDSLGKNSKVRAGGSVSTLAGAFVVGVKSKDEVTETPSRPSCRRHHAMEDYKTGVLCATG